MQHSAPCSIAAQRGVSRTTSDAQVQAMLVDGYTPAEIVGEMLVVLLCGVRPMANTLARALWELSRQPMLQAKMQYSPRFAAATSAPGLGSPQPLMHRDWAHPCHICTGTGLTSATCAPGLASPLPHLQQDWAHQVHGKRLVR
jgi:hypothetical protein